ncbi:MAG: hypothetical protein IPN90_08050 [Elusimicrobia bacterium]|nr:hypothetical protein [Elusimicrobiota bacterium]
MRFRWAWGVPLLSLAWGGLVFFHVHRYFDLNRTELFRQEGRRLVVLWAERIAETEDPPERERMLRRFSGERDSRSATLLDDQGQILLTVGDSSPPPPRLPLSEPADRPREGDRWDYWAPLWIDGRRAGYLAWVRDSSALKKDRAHVRRGLLAAGAWAAALGCLGTVLACRSPQAS